MLRLNDEVFNAKNGLAESSLKEAQFVVKLRSR